MSLGHTEQPSRCSLTHGAAPNKLSQKLNEQQPTPCTHCFTTVRLVAPCRVGARQVEQATWFHSGHGGFLKVDRVGCIGRVLVVAHGKVALLGRWRVGSEG